MIGIDIIETKRIKKLIKNKRFLNRVFSKEEIEYCESKKNKEQHYSARFAAKVKNRSFIITYKRIRCCSSND